MTDRCYSGSGRRSGSFGTDMVDILDSDTAVAVLAVITVLGLGVGTYLGAPGNLLRSRLEESRQMRMLGLLRTFHDEMAPVRKQEIADVLDQRINGSIGRIETALGQVSNKVDAISGTQAATEQRLSHGSTRMAELAAADQTLYSLVLDLSQRVSKLEGSR